MDDELIEACGPDPRLMCESIFDWTSNATIAKWGDWLLDRPLRILFILILAGLVNRAGRKLATRFAGGLAVPLEQQLDEESPVLRGIVKLGKLGEQNLRAQQRANTLGAVLRSLVTTIVWTIAALLILGEIGINLAPLVAGAGIAGVAIGFGAQSVVRDFLSGIFVLIEDQYGVGDYIDAGDASGTVEVVSLRTTRLRDKAGVLWIVPNGEIKRVGNYSQLYSQTRMQFEVGYETNIDEAMDVIKGVLDQIWHEHSDDATVIEEPRVLGIDSFGASAVVLSAIIKTDPEEQWNVARLVRARIKKAFDEHGIDMPYPQQTVWLRKVDEPVAAAAPSESPS